MAKERKQTPSIALDYGKIPPQALDIEEAVIGALLLEGSYSSVSHLLKKDSVIFYKEAHNIILEAIIDLYEHDIGIDLLTVTNWLRNQEKLENAGGASYLVELMSRVASDKHLIYHCTIITDKYLLRELIRIGSEMMEKGYDESNDPNDIADWAEHELQERFDLDIEGRALFKDALISTLKDIVDKQKGLIQTFVKTGDSHIDQNLSIRLRQICLIAGAEGSGKTKYATYLVKGILDHNPNVGVLWFSMEDSKEQIVRSFISMITRFTTKQLQSINYKLTDEDYKIIKQSADNFNDYKIEFVDRVCSIRTIMRKTKQFKDRNPEKMIIVVIDNLGLITTDSYYKGIEKDDFLAGKIKDLCDQTESSIFLLHHITKKNAEAFNLKEGYRPRKEHIKGSTRILDYVQQAIMVNLPRKYKDLVLEEKQKAKILDFKERTGKFDFTRFIMEFWNLNPENDRFTKNISDLRQATWDELKFAVTMDKMPDGTDMKAGYILRKYAEYLVSVEDKNRHRQEQYHEAKLSIHTFITKKMYHHDYSPKNNTRTYYLYGNDLTLAKELNSLFIAEIIKNRDGSDTDEHNLIRYRANLDYNIFELINNTINEIK